jgi:hypothetical protein
MDRERGSEKVKKIQENNINMPKKINGEGDMDEALERNVS